MSAVEPGGYVALYRSGELERRVRALEARLAACDICPRECGADRLGGKAYCVFSGTVANVEAAVEVAVSGLRDADNLVAQVVIPQLHSEMLENLEAAPEFGSRIATLDRDESSAG